MGQPLRDSFKKHGIAGASFVLLRDSKVAAREVYGMAHLAEKRPVDENTIFHWASITKTFTGIAILQLRDRGLLKLDDPVIQYLPELREVHNPYGKMSDITLRHLLTHSAGFRDVTWPWGGDKPWHPHEPQHWSQLVAMMPYTEILFPPGSKFSYSNLGVIFLGRIIEQITTDDYEVYIDKNIFKPLEMYRSYFDRSPNHLTRYLAHSYYLKDGKPEPARFDLNTGITVSNGGLNAPFGDMVKYLKFLMEGNEEVLKRSSLDEMFQPQIPIEPGKAMGLTFFVEDHYGMRYIGHSGSQNAFLTHFYVDPKARAGYLVAFNTQGPDTRALDAEVAEYVFKLLRTSK